jgi:purine-binding chemotaxis protein CheW
VITFQSLEASCSRKDGDDMPQNLPQGVPDTREEERLRERAVRLAGDALKAAPPEDELEVVEFRLGNERYGADSLSTGEIFPLQDLTPLPCTPPFVVGIVNLRGRIISVVDLKVFFGIPRETISEKALVLVLESPQMEMGILVDALVGVRRIPRKDISPPLPTMTGIGGAYLLGLAEEDLGILKVAAILEDPALVIREEA